MLPWSHGQEQLTDDVGGPLKAPRSTGVELLYSELPANVLSVSVNRSAQPGRGHMLVEYARRKQRAAGNWEARGRPTPRKLVLPMSDAARSLQGRREEHIFTDTYAPEYATGRLKRRLRTAIRRVKRERLTLYRMTGVDLTQDRSQLVEALRPRGLPNNRITGGNGAARPSPAPTGPRRPCVWRPTRCTAPAPWAPSCAGRKLGAPKAITATAHKLARLI